MTFWSRIHSQSGPDAVSTTDGGAFDDHPVNPTPAPSLVPCRGPSGQRLGFPLRGTERWGWWNGTSRVNAQRLCVSSRDQQGLGAQPTGRGDLNRRPDRFKRAAVTPPTRHSGRSV